MVPVLFPSFEAKSAAEEKIASSLLASSKFSTTPHVVLSASFVTVALQTATRPESGHVTANAVQAEDP